MVCRHCPRPPWRPAPIAFLLPPLLLSLALATTHRPHTNTTPPTLSYTPPPPTTQATEHHAHQHTHIQHQHFLAFAAARTAPEHREDEKQCATVAPLDEKSIPKGELEAKCQTCSRDNEACVQGREPCPPLSEELCSTEEGEKREELIRKRTLRYCPHLVLYSVMCEEQVESIRNRTLAGCSTVARHLQEMDNMVGRVLQQHKAIITTYNCEHSYSIRQTCTECQEAYRYWVCSQLFPYYEDGVRVKPCRGFCHDVEQKCPYFLPKDKPVAGEPTFLCEDPNIGELEEQESSYGPDSCCYHTCSVDAVMGFVKEIPEHEPHPIMCSTCPSSTTTTTTASSTSTTTTTTTAAEGSGSSRPPQEEEHRVDHSQCLSTSDAAAADSCLLHSNPSPVSPLSSASCSVISRKHCWTRTALYILLLYLVRTRVLLPRGFT